MKKAFALAILAFSFPVAAEVESLNGLLEQFRTSPDAQRPSIRSELASLAERKLDLARGLRLKKRKDLTAKRRSVDEFLLIHEVISKEQEPGTYGMALANAGLLLWRMGFEYEGTSTLLSAKEYLDDAGHHLQSADVLADLAELYRSIHPGLALNYLEEAIQRYEVAGTDQRYYLAKALETKGWIHAGWGSTSVAEDAFVQARRLYESVDKHLAEVALLEADSARLLIATGRIDEALEQAKALAYNSPSNLPAVRCDLFTFYLGNLNPASRPIEVSKCDWEMQTSPSTLGFRLLVDIYDQLQNHRLSDAYNRKVGGRWGNGLSLNGSRGYLKNTVEIYGLEHVQTANAFLIVADREKSRGFLDQAEKNAKAALAIRMEHAPHDVSAIIDCLAALAEIYRLRGDYKKTQEAVKAIRDNAAHFYTNRRGYHELLERFDSWNYDLDAGNFGGAEKTLKSQLDYANRNRGAKSPSSGAAHFGLASLYATTGNRQQAITHLEDYLSIADQLAYRPWERSTARALLAELRGDVREAIGHQVDARRQIKRGNCACYLFTVQNLKELLRLSILAGELEEAEKYLALLEETAFFRNSETPLHAEVLLNRAQISFLRNDLDAAMSFAQQGYFEALKFDSPARVFGAESLLAILLKQAGDLSAAVFFSKSAVNNIQKIRQSFSGSQQQLEEEFLRQFGDHYRNLADLLIDLGRLPEAQQALHMLKQEELFQYVRRQQAQSSPLIALSPEEKKWQARYEEIKGQIGQIALEARDLKVLKTTTGLSPEQKNRLRQLRSDLTVSRKAFGASLDELREDIAAAGGERAIEFGRRDLRSLVAVQGLLKRSGERTSIVHYLVMEDKVRILLTTPEVSIHRDTDVSVAALNRAIFRFRQSVETPESDIFSDSSDLYAWLIEPIIGDLRQSKTTRVLLSLDTSLRYLPFAAISDGDSFLVEEFDIGIYTPAGSRHLVDYDGLDYKAAAFGTSLGFQGLAPLKAVLKEVSGIVQESEDDADGVIPGIVRVNDQFTLDALQTTLENEADPFPLVHIASHFVFSPGNESNSFLLLGTGQRVSLKELRDEGLMFHGVRLLTLSACNTATEGGDGAEVESFAALAQNRGASGVVASLWPVSDEGTAEFMMEFYRRLKASKLDSAHALSATQRSFLRQGKAYEHPFYWSAFVFLGV